MLSALLVSDLQLKLIIATAAVFGVLFVANSILFALFFYKRKRSSLSTKELQQQRDELLEELAQLRNAVPKKADVEESDKPENTGDIVVEEDDKPESLGDIAAEENGNAEIPDDIKDETEESVSDETVNEPITDDDGDIE